MPAYLLTWNPRKYDWEGEYPGALARNARRHQQGKPIELDWSCSHSKRPSLGDRAFLIRLGKEPRGIFASGWLSAGSAPSNDPKFGPRGVRIRCDVFLDPGVGSNLLDPRAIAGQHWTPESSGTSIRLAALAELEQLWARHLRNLGTAASPREVSGSEASQSYELEAVEGELRERLVRHRVRERALRDAKLQEVLAEHGKVHCEVCSFSFLETFGVECAEVHHLKPLASRSNPASTRLSELAVLCPNCHRVAHSRPERPWSIAELRRMRDRRP